MQVKRLQLLALLKDASVGLTRRDTIEQSSSFAFTEGMICTFNDDLLFKTKSPLDITASIPADDFVKVLERMPDDDLEIIQRGGEVVLKGHRRTAGVAISSEIRLPIGDIPAPDKWFKLEAGIVSTLQQAAETCSQDMTIPLATMVHVTPGFIEASDNTRMFRYTGATGFKEKVLIPAASLYMVARFKLTKASVGKGWVYFGTEQGYELALRCSHEKYHEGLEALLAIEDGEAVSLPANLGEMISRAEIMNETAFDARVSVRIEDGEIILESRKDTGWYRERKKIRYSGRPLAFEVHPKFLCEVLERTHDVIVGQGRLKINVDKVQFLVALVLGDETKEAANEGDSE